MMDHFLPAAVQNAAVFALSTHQINKNIRTIKLWLNTCRYNYTGNYIYLSDNFPHVQDLNLNTQEVVIAFLHKENTNAKQSIMVNSKRE